MGSKIYTQSSSLVSNTKKNLLFVTILIVSVILAVSAFASHTSWILTAFDNGGTAARPTLSQDYINVQYANTSINITQNITVVNSSVNVFYINITGLNLTGWNFTGFGPSNNTCCSTPLYGNSSTLASSINITNGSTTNTSSIIRNGTNSTIWFSVGINASVEGRYDFVMNITSAYPQHLASQHISNYSNFTILADWTNPTMNNSSVNGSGTRLSSLGGTGYWFNRSINVSLGIGDLNLNMSTSNGGVNITIKNITSGNDSTATTFATPNITCAYTGGTTTYNWTCSAPLTAYATPTDNVPTQNFTFYVVAFDNATNSVNASSNIWFIYDNTRPNVSSTSPANDSTSFGINSNITITFTEAMNMTSVNDTSSYKMGKVGGGSLINFTVEQQSSGTQVMIDPVTLENNVGYWIMVYGNGSQNRDLVGNFMNYSYNFTFTTVDVAGGGTGGGGGGGGSGGSGGAPVIPDLVSETKPTVTYSMNTGESGSVTVGGTKCTIKIKSITSGYVTIVITCSAPREIQLRTNIPAYIDLDQDGDNDLIVTVLQILSASAARMKFEYIAAAAQVTASRPVAPLPAYEEETPQPAAEGAAAGGAYYPPEAAAAGPQPLSSRAIMGIVVVVIIVLIGLGYMHMERQQQDRPKSRKL